MGYLFLDRPQAYPQLRTVRRNGAQPSGVVVLHTFEWPWRRGATPAAEYLLERTTPGGYHRLVDWQDRLALAPWSAEVWHDTGTNNHAVGISAAVYAAEWSKIPEDYRVRIVHNMAREAADYNQWLQRTRGITIPARRITRAESRRGVPGFIGHGESDPGRRTDPGRDFPWQVFLDHYRALTTTDDTERELSMSDVQRILDAIEGVPQAVWDHRVPMTGSNAEFYGPEFRAGATLGYAGRGGFGIPDYVQVLVEATAEALGATEAQVLDALRRVDERLAELTDPREDDR